MRLTHFVFASKNHSCTSMKLSVVCFCLAHVVARGIKVEAIKEEACSQDLSQKQMDTVEDGSTQHTNVVVSADTKERKGLRLVQIPTWHPGLGEKERKGLLELRALWINQPSFMLINTGSGGNEGQRLLTFMKSEYPHILATSLATLEGTEVEKKMLALLRSVVSKKGQDAPLTPHVRVVCAGGDGTASWCLARLARFQQMLEFQDLPVALVMCPLGT
jgi:hypothetical protein